MISRRDPRNPDRVPVTAAHLCVTGYRIFIFKPPNNLQSFIPVDRQNKFIEWNAKQILTSPSGNHLPVWPQTNKFPVLIHDTKKITCHPTDHGKILIFPLLFLKIFKNVEESRSLLLQMLFVLPQAFDLLLKLGIVTFLVRVLSQADNLTTKFFRTLRGARRLTHRLK